MPNQITIKSTATLHHHCGLCHHCDECHHTVPYHQQKEQHHHNHHNDSSISINQGTYSTTSPLHLIQKCQNCHHHRCKDLLFQALTLFNVASFLFTVCLFWERCWSLIRYPMQRWVDGWVGGYSGWLGWVGCEVDGCLGWWLDGWLGRWLGGRMSGRVR